MDRGVSTLELRIAEDATGERIDRAAARVAGDLSRERIKALMLAGHVVDARGVAMTDPSRKAIGGEVVRVSLPEAAAATAVAQAIPLVVVHEDEDLIVIDKPAGLVVHPAAGNPDGTLVNALLHHCSGQLSGIGGVARPGIVHRIDKDTSGLMVAAKTDIAHEGLGRQFRDHSIDRRYRAIVSGRPLPPAGSIDAPLARSSSDRKKMAIVSSGKRAVTHYTTVERLSDAAMVECRLETGRTHQVRVHLTSIGHPLLGDPVYGRTKPVHRAALETLGFRRQALHAARIGFIHPVTRIALAFDSEMPADMQELFKHLRG